MPEPAGQPGPVETMLASDAASRMFGIELLDYGQGWARAQLTVRDDLLNGHGMCHGGVIFALADTAFACACNSWGPVTVAADADIVFVAPARGGDLLTAECRVRARYGRSGIYDVTVSRDDQLVAEFRGRSHELAERRSLSRPAYRDLLIATCATGGRRTRSRTPRLPVRQATSTTSAGTTRRSS